MIKNLSNGFENIRGENISLVDERMEIAAMYKGTPQNEIGVRTDVMCNLPKSIGIKMIVSRRSSVNVMRLNIFSKNDLVLFLSIWN